MVVVWILVVAILLVGAIASLVHWRRDGAHVIDVVEHGEMKAHVDMDGCAVAVEYSDRGRDDPVSREVSASLFPMHMFALGALTGVSFSLLVAKLILKRPGPVNYAMWLFAWLSLVLVVSALVFLVERYYLSASRRRGTFDRFLAAGEDPLRIAATIYQSMRMYSTWSAIVMFLGAGLLCLVDARGLVIAVMMVMMSCALVYRWAQLSVQPIRMRMLDRHFLSVRDFICDGGWVMPVGTLLCTASLGLMYFGRTEAIALMLLMIAGCVLVAWSEAVSRGEARKLTFDEWQELFRGRMASPATRPSSLETSSP
jgi:hypothetical protein